MCTLGALYSLAIIFCIKTVMYIIPFYYTVSCKQNQLKGTVYAPFCLLQISSMCILIKLFLMGSEIEQDIASGIRENTKKI